MIEIKNLSVSFNKPILKDINLTITKEKIHAILGPSGAGKSTLINAILGVCTINSGEILIDGRNYLNVPIYKRDFGYVPQNLALFPHLSVKENILFSQKIKKRVDKILFDKLVQKAQIASILSKYPNTLSGGQKQRVALLRALIKKPKLLLLDEPFSALDITLKKEMWELLKELQSEFGITTLLITHDLDEARYLANEASILINGKIEQSNRVDKIFDYPKNIKVARYLGFKNIVKSKAISSNKLYIEQLGRSYEVAYSLIKNKKYNVLIKSEAICFTKEKNAFFINPKVYELNRYKEVKFEINAIAFEVILGKQEKVTNYVTFLPNNFILLNE